MRSSEWPCLLWSSEMRPGVEMNEEQFVCFINLILFIFFILVMKNRKTCCSWACLPACILFCQSLWRRLSRSNTSSQKLTFFHPSIHLLRSPSPHLLIDSLEAGPGFHGNRFHSPSASEAQLFLKPQPPFFSLPPCALPVPLPSTSSHFLQAKTVGQKNLATRGQHKVHRLLEIGFQGVKLSV